MTVAPRRPIVYIAGPFRGAHDWDRHCNVHEAECAALLVWRMGGVALCPHNNTRHFDGALPDHVWLEGDIELLRVSHGVLMLDRWQASSGARAEHDIAVTQLLLPVFYAGMPEGYDTLQRWILTWRENRAAGVPL
jgi:hypothetical protein